MYRMLSDLARAPAIAPAVLVESMRGCEQDMLARHKDYASGLPFFPPVFAQASQETAFGRFVEDLLALFATFPHRLAEKQGFDALLTRLGYGPAQRELLLPYMTAPWLAAGTDLARFDVIATKDGFRAIELNATGGIGGLGVIEDYVATFEASALAQALRNCGVAWRIMKPIDSLRALMIRRARDRGLYQPDSGEPLRVAQAVLPEDMNVVDTVSSEIHLRSSNVDVVTVSLFDLEIRAGGVYFEGRRIHVVWSPVSFEAVLNSPELWAKMQEFLTAAADGELIHLVPPTASVFGNKNLLALITSQRENERFTAAERTLIDRSVPWTARVDEQALDEITRRQGELVLKPANGVAGLGVLFGAKLSPKAWRLAITKIASSNMPFVAQCICVPAPMLMPAGTFAMDEVSAIDLVLGGIAIEGRFAGNIVRGQSTGSLKPINCHAGGRFAAACIIQDTPAEGP